MLMLLAQASSDPAATAAVAQPWWVYVLTATLVPIAIQIVRYLEGKAKESKLVQKIGAEAIVVGVADGIVRQLQTYQKNNEMTGHQVRNMGIAEAGKVLGLDTDKATKAIDSAHARMKEAAALIPFLRGGSSESPPG